MGGQIPGGGMMPQGGGPSMTPPQPSTGNFNPQLSGGSQTGPLPPTGIGGMFPAPGPQPFSGMGQSFQNPVLGRPPMPAQPPNPGVASNPGISAKPPAPAPPMKMPPTALPPQPNTGVAQANKMMVHNPTGMGADAASQMAAVRRPIPANRPVKKDGNKVPSPQNIPGASGA